MNIARRATAHLLHFIATDLNANGALKEARTISMSLDTASMSLDTAHRAASPA